MRILGRSMTIFRFSVALLTGLLVTGCGSKEAFTCVGKTYDPRFVDAPPMPAGNITFVILDRDTLQRSDQGGRSPAFKAMITETDINAVVREGGNETKITIDRVKGAGQEASFAGQFLFITSLTDCKKVKAPVLEGKI